MTKLSERLLSAGLFLGAALYTLTPIRAADFWWHLASGRFIWETRSVPRVDPFSLTSRGLSWVNIEWLYDAGLFSVLKAAGWYGVWVLKTLLVLAVLYFLLKRLALYAVPRAAAIVTAAAVFWAARYGWMERPDLVSLALVSALIWRLEAVRLRQAEARSLWPWPFLFVLWSNIHPGFVLGWAVLGFYTVGVPLPARERKILCLIGVLCAASSLLNPFGTGLHQAIIRALTLAGQVDQSEFQWTPWSPMQAFWVLLAVFAACLARTLKGGLRFPPAVWGISALLVWEAVRHVRYTPFFLIVAFPFAVPVLLADPWLKARIQSLPVSRRQIEAAVAAALVLLALCSVHRVSFGVDRTAYPIEACEFVAAHPVPGAYYNDYNFGSYWIWRFAGQPPVFIDGRSSTVEGYTELRRQIHWAKGGSPENWNTFLEGYQISAALMPYPGRTPFPSVYQTYFPRDRWALVYWDDLALLFVKRTSASRGLIEGYEFPTLTPDSADEDFREAVQSASSLQKKRWQDEITKNLQQHPDSRRAQRLLSLVRSVP